MSVGLPCVLSDDALTTIPLTDDLTLTISTSSSMELETGGSIWHAGMALTNHLLKNDSIVKDKVVLEIGAGCALPGIASGLLGTRVVILTDMPEQVPHLQKNVDLNSKQCSSCEFICVPFMFGDSIHDLVAQLQKKDSLTFDPSMLSIDVILGCDIAYDVSLHEPLLSSVQSLLLPTTSVLLAEEVRWRDIYGWFLESLDECTTSSQHYVVGSVINIFDPESHDNKILPKDNLSLFEQWYADNMPIINRYVRLNELLPESSQKGSVK